MKDYFAFAHTNIGFSHIASQKVCQDYSMKDQDKIASIIVVSDGHGSANFTRSDRGSRFACEVAVDAIKEFLQNLDLERIKADTSRDDVVRQLCKYILLRWNKCVDEDAANHPFTEKEVEQVSDKYRDKYLCGKAIEHAYGCTLIVAVITLDFCLVIRNGDGQCVAVDKDGEFTAPIPWNEKCEFNVTTSLCDPEAIDDFRYFYSDSLPAALFIGSDGVDDSYTSVDELYNLYRNICLKVLTDGETAASDYVEQLLPEITRRGSTDDVSIAGLIYSAALENGRASMDEALKMRQMQLEKQRKEQQERILTRDIKVANKRRSKLITQREEVREKRQRISCLKESLLEKISSFKKKAEDCQVNTESLLQEEQNLTQMINGVDSEIDRLVDELKAMGGQINPACDDDFAIPQTNEPGDIVVQEIDSMPDFEEYKACEPKNEGAVTSHSSDTELESREFEENPA